MQSYSLWKSSQDLSSQISQSPASFLSFPGTKHTRPAGQAWSSASRTSEHWSSHCCQGTWSLATKSTVCTSEIFWTWKTQLEWTTMATIVTFCIILSQPSISSIFLHFQHGSAAQKVRWVSDTAATQWCNPYPESCRSGVRLALVITLPRLRDEVDRWNIYPFISYLRLLKWVSCCFTPFAFEFYLFLFFLLCLSFVFLVQALLQIRAITTACSLRLAPKSTNTETTVLHAWDYQTGGIERSRVPLSNGGHTQEIPIIDAVTARETWETLTTDHSEIAGSLKYDLWMNQVGKTWSIPSPVDQTIRSACRIKWYHRYIMIYPLASNSSALRQHQHIIKQLQYGFVWK